MSKYNNDDIVCIYIIYIFLCFIQKHSTCKLKAVIKNIYNSRNYKYYERLISCIINEYRL
jgi:hypothetical protein